MVINRDVTFDEKACCRILRKMRCKLRKNHCSDEYVIQVELETHNAKDDT